MTSAASSSVSFMGAPLPAYCGQEAGSPKSEGRKTDPFYPLHAFMPHSIVLSLHRKAERCHTSERSRFNHHRHTDLVCDWRVNVYVRFWRLDADDQRVSRLLFPRPEKRRSEEHTSELQSLMSISYAVLRLKKTQI